MTANRAAGDPDGQGGTMSSCDPKPPSGAAAPAVQAFALTELEPGRAKGNGAAHAPTGSGALASALRQVRVTLTVRVGAAELSVGELVDARAGQVVRLDRAPEEPVDVLLDGQVVARGTLVAVDERFAVRITEVPLALDLSSAAHD
jgi:flagellar motor switch protein FliN/FliY